MTKAAERESREQWIDGTGGRIFVRHWQALDVPIASLVICHGFNAHSGHYERAANLFASRGIAVTAFDLRGRGRSDGERFYVDTFQDYVSDLAAAVEFARMQVPGRPVFVLGHSAGGVVATSYAVDHQEEIAGLISESLAYRLYAPRFALALFRGMSHVLPHTPVVRLKMNDFSRDPAWMDVLNADPLVGSEVQPIATMAALARANATLETRLPRLAVPLLVLHGTADEATRPEGSEAVFAAARSSDKSLKLYPKYRHDLLNDLGRDYVTNDIGNWVEARSRYISVSMTPPSTRNAAPVVAEARGEAR
ncbi:lysophospholipase [Sphingomonas sp. Tas61C01]|uniref:lysophospholipase n=1 Tax=Sphingomonas sp. Tas61C01 TaxID=3458297 RepID=UPI00403E3B74